MKKRGENIPSAPRALVNSLQRSLSFGKAPRGKKSAPAQFAAPAVAPAADDSLASGASSSASGGAAVLSEAQSCSQSVISDAQICSQKKEEEEEEENGISGLNLGHVSTESDVLKAAAVAFWAQRFPKAEYMEAVMEVILQGGDASANGCMAGAIMGLRVGFGKLPTHWLAHLHGREWLVELAEQYTNLFWG